MFRFALVLLLLVTGCAQKAADFASAPESADKKTEANRYLAYEHEVSIETDDDQIVPLAETVQAACRAAVAESCAILKAEISRGEYSHATLKFRARAEGIQKLIAALAAQGKITNQSTTAEDLAGPIHDAEKQLSMLVSYRGQLEALRARAGNEVDALMKLSRELAQVQSDIETLSGTQAHLVQRVETEILTVSILSTHAHSAWSTVGDSVGDFGDDFAMGISTVITALAYLIPWGTLVLCIVWAIRKWWRRRHRG